MPEALKPQHLKLKRGDDPVFYKKGDLLACSWHDTTRVNFLSTIDGVGSVDKELRTKKSNTGFRTIKKPNVAVNYNNYMGGVDLMDQLLSTYPYTHKVSKWYLVMYHFIKEAALVNSYILYKAAHPTSSLTSEKFRREVADSLCSGLARTAPAPLSRRSTESVVHQEFRLSPGHYPTQYNEPAYKPNCVVCSFSASHPTRKQTRSCCDKCVDSAGKAIAMCAHGCFKAYHTTTPYHIPNRR